MNVESSTGNTLLMNACAGGLKEAVKLMLKWIANENGHTPSMKAASSGHIGVAKVGRTK